MVQALCRTCTNVKSKLKMKLFKIIQMKRYILISLILIAAASAMAQSHISDLVVTPASGGTIKWYDASTNGTQYTTPATTALVTGTTYYASQTVNGVESTTRLAVTATVTATPAAPTAGDVTITYDGLSHIGTATAPPGSHVVWYDAATNGNVTVAPTGTNVGTYTAWAESVVDVVGCKSATRTLVTLNVTQAVISTTIGGIAPVVGGHPVMSINNAEYTATLSWSIVFELSFPVESNDTFSPGNSYNVTVSITPKSNYKLPVAGTSFSITGGNFVAYYLSQGNVIASFFVGNPAPQ
jgi:hypothetical protein